MITNIEFENNIAKNKILELTGITILFPFVLNYIHLGYNND
ncbi:hypothetical protein SC08_Contig83orf01980 [Clostridium butyricum]|nr:hypothetical protein SC08_Contig83orf01980 [Clostridium butyricum]